MILVVGGTGTLGRPVVSRLMANGLPVRVFTRRPEAVPAEWADRVEHTTGDVRSPGDLAAAMSGVDMVVSLIQGFGSPERDALQTIDLQGNANVIDAAAASGASVVLLSIVRADSQSRIELFRVKHDAEQHLRRSGAPWTVVRATAYMETWLDLMEQTAADGGRPLVFGHGRNPINFVAADDVAALVERCVVDPSTRRLSLQIGGPENLTLNRVAAAAQRAAGRTGPPRHVSRATLRMMAATMGRFQPLYARQARLALLMDTADMTFDSAPLHATLPGLPVTTLREALAARTTSTPRTAASAVRQESPLAR
ncbi:MAG TPA: NAD(P)H-binding protein [Candidatus Dormibacteraeota bacterium]